MSLSQQITDDMKEAMKAKNDATLSTLRLLRSAMKNKQIDVQHELSDTEIQEVIKTQVKQLKDAINDFKAGGRMDLAEANQKELDVLSKYLPTELSDDELQIIVKEAVGQSGAVTKSDMGKAMGFVMRAVAGRADGTRVKTLVELLLGVFIFSIFSTIFTTHSVQAAGMSDLFNFGSFAYQPYFTFGLRLTRVLFLWGGLFSINEILRGGFIMTTGSVRDDLHHLAEHKMISGLIGVVIVIGVFYVTTMMLDQLGK